MRKFLVFTQLFYVLLLAPWFPMWVMSPMMFDAGISWQAFLALGALTAYPILVVGCSLAAWILWNKRKPRASLYLNLVPALVVVAFLVTLAAFE